MFSHETHSHSGRTDQAYRLRQLMAGESTVQPEARRSAHVIAVASGKGGVGKTMVAANLAIALAARSHRVILFDMDMGLANADIVLGVQAMGTWIEFLNGHRSLDDVIVRAPGEIAFVPGSSGISQVANLSEFERHQLMSAMRRIEEQYDVIILDCGAGISRNVMGFAQAADTILVVATPEPTAITDAYATIKVFAQSAHTEARPADPLASIGIVVNLAESRREGRETFERLASVAARFLHLPVSDYGYILRDDHVPSAVRQRCPVLLQYPRCSASSCLMATAAKLSKEVGWPEANQSLFYRVMNMFL